MATIDVLNIGVRIGILSEIKGEENKQRKAESLKQFEIYSDRMHRYVEDYLRTQFSDGTVSEMPIISSVNLSKRIVDQQSTVYRDPPVRAFSELSDDQQEVAQRLYAEAMANVKLDKSNKRYKLQNQNLLQVVPKEGKLIIRTYLQHQYDVVPSMDDPEKPEVVIVSVFDKFDEMPSATTTTSTPSNSSSGSNSPLYSDGQNQVIADKEDYKALSERYVWWTEDYNFVTDGRGNVLSAAIDSPVKGVLPFIDVAYDKDFEYYNRQGQSVTDFTIQYNAALSDLANVVRMQSYGQAYLIAEAGTHPQNLQVGPNHILKMAVNSNTEIRPEFGFANSNADLEGSIQYIELLLANFLSSRGIDAKTISGNAEGSSYASGVERLLALVERFEVSKEDFTLYGWVEARLWTIIKAWHNALRGTPLLDSDLQTKEFSDKSKVMVKFSRPEAVQTDSEKLDIYTRKTELGLMSRVEAIMMDRGITEEQAIEVAKKIDETSGLTGADDVEDAEETEGEDMNKPDTAAPAPQATGVDVSKEVLNGAQSAALVEIVSSVSAGMIPRDAGVQIVALAYKITTAEASALMGSAGGSFKAAVNNGDIKETTRT